MAEWFKATVLKTVVPARVPWVRIPLSPPTLRGGGASADKSAKISQPEFRMFGMFTENHKNHT